MGRYLLEFFLLAFAAYLAGGLLFAIPFVMTGVNRIDPHARRGSVGFRILILPGSVLLWPLLASRWLTGAPHPPEERSAHRELAMGSGTPNSEGL